jgi:hypothetical protein
MKLSSEVLIYVQTIKNYLETNQEARDYFLKNADYDLFFDNLAQISEINFQKTGEPQLSQQQFEFLKISMMIFKEVEKEEEINQTIYDYIPQDIKFYLK